MVHHTESWVSLPVTAKLLPGLLRHSPQHATSAVHDGMQRNFSTHPDCRAAEHLHVKPGKGAAFVRTKLKNSITSNTIDKTFRAGETVASATVEKKDSQFTYADGNEVGHCSML